MFFDVLSFVECKFLHKFSDTIIQPFGGIYITLNKTSLSFLLRISVKSDPTWFELMDRSVRGSE